MWLLWNAGEGWFGRGGLVGAPSHPQTPERARRMRHAQTVSPLRVGLRGGGVLVRRPGTNLSVPGAGGVGWDASAPLRHGMKPLVKPLMYAQCCAMKRLLRNGAEKKKENRGVGKRRYLRELRKEDKKEEKKKENNIILLAPVVRGIVRVNETMQGGYVLDEQERMTDWASEDIVKEK